MGPSRGEVWWAHIPGLGERPALVVSADLLNRSLGEVTVLRVTAVDRERGLPTYVEIPQGELAELPARSYVLCHNAYTLPKSSLQRPLGPLAASRMVAVEEAMRFALDL